MVLHQEATSMETSGSIFSQMGNNMKSRDGVRTNPLFTRESQYVVNELAAKDRRCNFRQKKSTFLELLLADSEGEGWNTYRLGKVVVWILKIVAKNTLV